MEKNPRAAESAFAAAARELDANVVAIERVTIVRGRHQLSVGANISYWTSDTEDNARAAGDFNFNGQSTGLALADFLTERAVGHVIGVIAGAVRGLDATDQRALDAALIDLDGTPT